MRCNHAFCAFILDSLPVADVKTQSCFWYFSIARGHLNHTLFKALTIENTEGGENILQTNLCIYFVAARGVCLDGQCKPRLNGSRSPWRRSGQRQPALLP